MPATQCCTIDSVRRRALQHLDDIGYRRDPRRLQRTGAGVRDRLFETGTQLRISDTNRFEVKIPATAYVAAVVTDWQRGLVRIRRQNDALYDLAKSNRVPVAWMLVTSYYASYFSLIELLRACGNYITYFNESDARTINESVSTTMRVRKGTYRGDVIADEGDNYVTIKYGVQSLGNHEIAWMRLRDMLRISPETTWEGQVENSVSMFLGGQTNAKWQIPSAVRSDWNYRFAERYGQGGDALGVGFRRLLLTRTELLSWIKHHRRQQFTTENQAIGIELIRTSLVDTVESLQAIF